MPQSKADKNWWELHVRAARGERLTTDERAIYDAAVNELDDRESFASIAVAKQARMELRDLEAEGRRLEERRQQLDAEIAAVESALAPQNR